MFGVFLWEVAKGHSRSRCKSASEERVVVAIRANSIEDGLFYELRIVVEILTLEKRNDC